MRYLRKTEAKTKRDGIRNGIKRIIRHKEMAELAQLKWYRYVVRMGDERYHKMAWQDRTHGKRPKRIRTKGYTRFGRDKKWNGTKLRAMTRDYKRRKALCTPFTSAGKRCLTK